MEFVNINTLMDRITRHPLLKDIPFETVVDYTIDFIRIMGLPRSFLEKTAKIDIEDYRGKLPCDFYEMIQVRLPKGPAFRYSTDNFHMSKHKAPHADLTYKLQGTCIFTSALKNGPIEIAYRALPIDDDGYPLIPDSSPYLRALELYVKKNWFTIQFDLGKLHIQVLQNATKDYSWAVGQAHADLLKPSIDQMEALSNMWNKALPDTLRNHETGYIHEGTKERLRIH